MLLSRHKLRQLPQRILHYYDRVADKIPHLPLRSVLPFAMVLLVLLGVSHLFLHSAWFEIAWTIILTGAMLYWLGLDLTGNGAGTIDQLGLAQYYIVMANVVYSLVNNWSLISSFNIILLVLLVISFPRFVIQLASIELCLIIFYQTRFLPSPAPALPLFDAVVVALAFGIGGIILSFARIAEAEQSETGRAQKADTAGEPHHTLSPWASDSAVWQTAHDQIREIARDAA